MTEREEGREWSGWLVLAYFRCDPDSPYYFVGWVQNDKPVTHRNMSQDVSLYALFRAMLCHAQKSLVPVSCCLTCPQTHEIPTSEKR